MEKQLKLTDRICVPLFKEQLEYIDGDSKMYRRRIFNELVNRAAMNETEVNAKRFHIKILQGQCVISEVELAKIVGCNRKTVHAILLGFERIGISLSEPIQQRTSIHTMYCIMSWMTHERYIRNAFFEKSASEVQSRLAIQRL